MSRLKAKKILILGKGYAANSLDREKLHLCSEFDEFIFTSRTKPNCTYFDLNHRQSWDGIQDQYDACVWTFPVYDLKNFSEFYDLKNHLFKKFILLGTSSIYKVQYDQELIKEQSKLDQSHKRFEIEDFFLKHGGMVLRLAGMYGPGKNPLDWVRQGRIQSGQRWVNWVHSSDIAQFIVHTVKYGQSGQVYIGADGRPTQWQEVFERCQVFPSESKKQPKKLSKKIDNRWTIEKLKIQLSFPNIFKGLKYT